MPQSLLNRRIVQIRGEASFAECHNCQKYGHKAMHCPNSVACGKCAGPHPTAGCVSEVSKCAACGGNHPVTHPDCIKWKEGLNQLRQHKNELIKPQSPNTYAA
jgi:NAD-dependent SIR2 family protein deacetylase